MFRAGFLYTTRITSARTEPAVELVVVDVITPAVGDGPPAAEEYATGFGVLKLARLKRLKNSEPNSRPTRSDNENLRPKTNLLRKSRTFNTGSPDVAISSWKRLDEGEGIEILTW